MNWLLGILCKSSIWKDTDDNTNIAIVFNLGKASVYKGRQLNTRKNTCMYNVENISMDTLILKKNTDTKWTTKCIMLSLKPPHAISTSALFKLFFYEHHLEQGEAMIKM
jgi:hypothetical protein